MKKLIKFVLSALVLSCIFSIVTSAAVSAKSYSGRMRDGFSWTMDLDTGTLTINGNGYFNDLDPLFYPSNDCWADYQNQIRHIVLGKGDTSITTGPGTINSFGRGRLIAFNQLPNLETYSGSLKDGFTWNLSVPDKMLTITGEGTLFADNFSGAWSAFDVKTLVLSDGIKRVGLNRDDKNGLRYSIPSFDTVQIGSRISNYNDLRGIASQKFELITDNPNFSVYDGVLYTKDYKRLLVTPSDRDTITLHPKTEALATYRPSWPNASIRPMVKQSFQVADGNTHYAVYDGALYTKDYTKLISCPTHKASIRFHPNLKIIGECSLWDLHNMKDLIIPWGVTTIDRYGIYAAWLDGSVIVPDTVQNVGEYPFGYGGHNSDVKCIVSEYNPIARTLEKWAYDAAERGVCEFRKNLNEFYPASAKQIQWKKSGGKYYAYDKDGSQITGWRQDQDGKWYYLDPQTGVMATGLRYINGKAYVFHSSGAREHDRWIQVNGKWYYLNSWGAGVVKYWKQSGNKWYFLQADGTMATSKWIKWHYQWYYVGKDGAMYTNRRTPDGYWVNGSGVWVR